METPYPQFPEDTTKSSKVFAASLTMVVLLVAGYALAAKLGGLWPFEGETDTVFCTQDAKLCPDGSYVGRTGPNCEFSACPNESETADWEIYKNQEYNFEFKYPQGFALGTNPQIYDWSKSIEEGQPGTFWLKITKDRWQERLAKKNSYQSGSSCTTNKDYFEESCEVISISPYVMKYIVRQAAGKVDVYYVIGDSLEVLFDGLLPSGAPDKATSFNDTDQKVIKQILSTFKFEDEAIEWKTYTNPEHGFEVKYPPTLTKEGPGLFEWKDSSGKAVFGITIRTALSPQEQSSLVNNWFDNTPTDSIVWLGRSGNKFVYQYCDGPACGAETVAFVIPHNTGVLALEFYGNRSMDETENQIFSTFKFTK